MDQVTIENTFYRQGVERVASYFPWEKLKNCNILVTGARGLIGSFLIDVLMTANKKEFTVYGMGRDAKSANQRFKNYKENFHFIQHDISFPLDNLNINFDYIIHAASNATPCAFIADPVGTIKGNVWGCDNLLSYGIAHGLKRFLYVSSGEVYGECNDSVYTEISHGYIDNVNWRSCYPNSKILSETLCVSYAQQYNIDTVIARPSHVYGPCYTSSDNRAFAQFLNNALQKQDIILKSSGLIQRSYCYIADCISGILAILFYGKPGNAYNIAPEEATSIKELAETIAQLSSVQCKIVLPSQIEQQQQSPISHAVLSSIKLKELGWKSIFNLKEGIERTLTILNNQCPNQ